MLKIDSTRLHTNSFGDTYFPEINGHSFDNIGVNSTFSKVFNAGFKKENHLYIIVGSDSGLLIPYLQNYQKDKGRHYIILESPSLISYIEKNIKTDKDLISIYPLDVNFHGFLDKYTEYTTHRRYSLVKSLAVIDSKSKQINQIWQETQAKYNVFDNEGVGFATNNIFVDTQLKNLFLNEIPVEKIKDSLKKCTAILLGGGPTLDENINWLKENQDNLIIFSVARISARLKKEKITPDFIVTVDPHDVSYDNSKSMLMYTDTSILIHANNANPKLLSQWEGVRAYMGSQFPWVDSEHSQPNNLKIAGPTVTNAMAFLMVYLGVEKIILSGVDFCHSKDGSTHEAGSIEAKVGKNLKALQNKVKTYSGRLAQTHASFASARNSMEEIVTYAKKNFNSSFYSISENSAFIENVNCINSTELKLTQINKFGILKNIKTDLAFNLKSYKKHLNDAKSYCQEMRRLCEKTEKLAIRGNKKSNTLFINPDKTDRLTHQIITIQQDLTKLMGEHEEFIFNYSVKSYQDFMNPSIKQDDMTHEEIKDSFINYFDGLINSSSPLKKSIETAIDILNLRILEVKGLKSITKIIKKWQAFDEYGRINNWLNINNLSINDIPQENQQEIQQILKKHQQELDNKDTRLEKQIKADDSLIKNFNSIQIFFDEKKVQELEALLKDMASKNRIDHQDLCKLGYGYLLEMKDLLDDAVEIYLTIKDQKVLMEGLKRIVHISLDNKDYNSALNALEVLTNYADEYYVFYADILGATGDIFGAVEIYTHYLQHNQEDTSAWIKLAKMLIHNKAQEPAINAINKIKELEPKNSVANKLMELATKL